MGGSCARRARCRHHAARRAARRSRSTSRCSTRSPAAEDARALPLSDEGARAGPGAQPHGARRAGVRAGDLRRRHAGRPAAPGADVGERDPVTRTCSTSASCPITTAGATCSRPRVRHRRRGPRVPRRLRLARGQRAAAPAAAGGRVRGRPQFLLASATIANPAELATSLTEPGGDGRLRRLGAAGRSGRSCSGTPVTDEELNLRASALGEGARSLSSSSAGWTLCFAKSRKAAELIHRFALDRLGREYADRLAVSRRVHARAAQRHRARLASGELLGVSATTRSSSASTSACSTA